MNSPFRTPPSLTLTTEHEGPPCYCRPGVLPVKPARRNASAIASPLAGPELFRRARVSAGRKCLSGFVEPISARAVVGRASGD
jgi:hypothetical protein